MLVDGTMYLTWLGAGAALGALTTYRVYSQPLCQQKEQKLQSSLVENEALSRTNLIYRERIEQLEKTLFSNDKYMEMSGEIEKLRCDNFKLRGKLRDLECLVQAEKKRVSRERVEKLEKTVQELRSKLSQQMAQAQQSSACHLEVIATAPTQLEVAATSEQPQPTHPEPTPKTIPEPKKWAPAVRVRKIT